MPSKALDILPLHAIREFDRRLLMQPCGPHASRSQKLSWTSQLFLTHQLNDHNNEIISIAPPPPSNPQSPTSCVQCMYNPPIPHTTTSTPNTTTTKPQSNPRPSRRSPGPYECQTHPPKTLLNSPLWSKTR